MGDAQDKELGGGGEECCKSYGVWNLEENITLGMCSYATVQQYVYATVKQCSNATVQLTVGEGNSTTVGVGQMPSSCVYWGRNTRTGRMRRDRKWNCYQLKSSQ